MSRVRSTAELREGVDSFRVVSAEVRDSLTELEHRLDLLFASILASPDISDELKAQASSLAEAVYDDMVATHQCLAGANYLLGELSARTVEAAP